MLRRTAGRASNSSNSDSEYTYVDGRTARLIQVKQVGFVDELQGDSSTVHLVGLTSR